MNNHVYYIAMNNIEYEDDDILIINNKFPLQLIKDNGYKLNNFTINEKYINNLIRIIHCIMNRFIDNIIDVKSTNNATYFNFNTYEMIFTYYDTYINIEICNNNASFDIYVDLINSYKNLHILYPRYFRK